MSQPSVQPSSRDLATTAWTAEQLQQNPHSATDKAGRVERMFAAIAQHYDLNNRLHSFGRDQAWRRCAVRLADVQSTDDVLDVACGTGDLAEAFAAVRPRSVIGVDFTDPMLALAREKAQRRRRHPGVPAPVYEHGDAMKLRFDDGSFDIVSIAFGIRNVTDPAVALREFHRVLRPAGRLVILEFSRPGKPMVRWGNDLYCRHIMPMTATLIARDRSGAYRYLPRSVETFLDHQQLRHAVEAAGFNDVQQLQLTFGVCCVTVARRTD